MWQSNLCDLTLSRWHCPENHQNSGLSHQLTLNQSRSLAEYLRYGVVTDKCVFTLILYSQDANKTCDNHFVGLLHCRMLCPLPKKWLEVNFQPFHRALVVQSFQRNEVSFLNQANIIFKNLILKGNFCMKHLLVVHWKRMDPVQFRAEGSMEEDKIISVSQRYYW